MKSILDIQKIIKSSLIISIIFCSFLANTKTVSASVTIPKLATSTFISWVFGYEAFILCGEMRLGGDDWGYGCANFPERGEGYFEASINKETFYPGETISLTVYARTLQKGGAAGEPGVGIAAYDENNVVVASCSRSDGCYGYSGNNFKAPMTPGTHTIHFTGCWRTGETCSNHSPITYTVLPPPVSVRVSFSPPPAITSFVPTTTTVPEGQSVTFNYNSVNTDPNSCYITSDATSSLSITGTSNTVPGPTNDQSIETVTSGAFTVKPINSLSASTNVKFILSCKQGGYTINQPSAAAPTYSSYDSAPAITFIVPVIEPVERCGRGTGIMCR